jgi:hypothetical protein
MDAADVLQRVSGYFGIKLEELDRRDKDRLKSMTLDAEEFIRRFLLHLLPHGFMRIRHFGFLANRTKKHALPQSSQAVGTQSRSA